MELNHHIRQISDDIKAGRFINEASVSQGIVLRLLHALDWQIFDSKIVSPEYSVEGGRVDFALCHPRSKPIVFIEVKQIGQAEGAERQLFEYAFHNGVPMAILTDGQEWHFYLPGEQGQYQERRVYKLDILERDIKESVHRFQRYLEYHAVSSGKAIEAARKDYQNVARNRQIKETLPLAWEKLIEQQDDLLIELVADKVESLCGYKPYPDTVANFFAENAKYTESGLPHKLIQARKPKTQPQLRGVQHGIRHYGFTLKGRDFQARNARDVMIQILGELARADSSFLDRFAARPKHGRKRRFVARSKSELYPDRPDLCEEHSHQLVPGWWVGTNYSKENIFKIVKMACEVAGLSFGRELTIRI